MLSFGKAKGFRYLNSSNRLSIGVTSGSSGPSTDAKITGIRSDGWSVDSSAPGSNQLLVVDEPGFDGTGTAVTRRISMVTTSRVRIPWAVGQTDTTKYLNTNLESNGFLHATRCALDYYVSKNAVVIGSAITNSSTEVIPKPVAQFIYPSGQLVGNTLSKEWLAVCSGHYWAQAGEEVACVEWSITDGTTTITRKQNVSEISNLGVDQYPVVCYMPTTDIDLSGFANISTITVRAKVYPFVGKYESDYSLSSVLDSTLETGRAFRNLTFYRDSTRIQNYVCVDATNGTAGGVLSTDQGTAEATPFQTFPQAFTALRTARSNGDIYGDVILLKGDVPWANPTFTGTDYSIIAPVYIRPASGSTADNSRITVSANVNIPTILHLWISAGYSRSGNFLFSVKSGGSITWERSSFSAGNSSTPVVGNNNICRIIGMVVSNSNGSLLQPTATAQFPLLRGVVASGLVLDKNCVVGCRLTNCSLTNNGVYTESGGFIGFGHNFAATTRTSLTGLASGNTVQVTGCAIISFVNEYASASGSTSFSPSADDAQEDTNHIVIHNSTFTGARNAGRCNIGYNDTNGKNKVHKWWSVVGTHFPQLNTKHDVFHGINDAQAEAVDWVNGWSIMYAVGFRDNCVSWPDATNNQNGIGSSFGQAFPGKNTYCEAALTTALARDPGFTDYKGTTVNSPEVYVAGAGNGTYTLKSGSPLANQVNGAVVRFDLAGLPRNITQTAIGAYRGFSEAA